MILGPVVVWNFQDNGGNFKNLLLVNAPFASLTQGILAGRILGIQGHSSAFLFSDSCCLVLVLSRLLLPLHVYSVISSHRPTLPRKELQFWPWPNPTSLMEEPRWGVGAKCQLFNVLICFTASGPLQRILLCSYCMLHQGRQLSLWSIRGQGWGGHNVLMNFVLSSLLLGLKLQLSSPSKDVDGGFS